MKSFQDLPARTVIEMFPSRVQSMLTGCVRMTQNRTGEITVHYEGGAKKSVPFSDMQLGEQTDFVRTFQRVWKRIEFGA